MRKCAKWRKIVFAAMIIVLALVFCACQKKDIEPPKAQKSYLDLSNWDFRSNGELELCGQWEFYYNQLLDYNDFESNRALDFIYLKVPGQMKDNIVDGNKLSSYGFGTLRLKIKLADKDIVYGLKTERILTAANIFIDDMLTASYGKVARCESDAKGIFSNSISYFEPDKNEINLIIQTSNFDDYSTSIGGFHFGLKDQLVKKLNKSLAIDMMVFGCIFVMSLYHFCLF